MRLERSAEIIAAIVIAIILIGEVVVYTTGQEKYSSSSNYSDGTVTYSMSVDGSETYNVLGYTTSLSSMTEVYIYYDESYLSDYEDVKVAVGARALDQKYYIEQLEKQLEYRSSIKVTVLGASDLADAMASDVASGTFSKGLVVISGALPDTVYMGSSTDTICT